MKLSLKKILCMFFALVTSLSLIACGPTNNDDEDDGGVNSDGTITIEFFGWGDTEELNNYQTLVNLFMEENPDIIVYYSGQSSEQYMTTLNNRANNLPDLFYMPDYEFYGWVADDMLKDISSYVTQDELDSVWSQAVDEYYFNFEDMSLGYSEGAGLYGLPKDLGPFTLVYNKTLLDSQINKLNLDRDTVYSYLDPTKAMTWNEFRTLCKMLDPDPNDNLYAISHYEIEAAVYSNNANFFTDDAKTQLIDQPEFIEAMQFIADLCIVDHVMPSSKDQVSTNGYQRFKAQGCIFSFMGPWDCASFWKTVNFDYDILPVPYNGANPDASSTAWVGSMGYCIPKTASKAKTAAAIKLAKYLCYNEDAQRKFYDLGQQVPNIVEMANDEYLNDTKNLIGEKGPINRSVWIDTINGTSSTDKIGGKVRARYYTYSSDWYDGFTEWINSKGMWDGTVTAEVACKGYATYLQQALDEMQADLS